MGPHGWWSSRVPSACGRARLKRDQHTAPRSGASRCCPTLTLKSVPASAAMGVTASGLDSGCGKWWRKEAQRWGSAALRAYDQPTTVRGWPALSVHLPQGQTPAQPQDATAPGRERLSLLTSGTHVSQGSHARGQEAGRRTSQQAPHTLSWPGLSWLPARPGAPVREADQRGSLRRAQESMCSDPPGPAGSSANCSGAAPRPQPAVPTPGPQRGRAQARPHAAPFAGWPRQLRHSVRNGTRGPHLSCPRTGPAGPPHSVTSRTVHPHALRDRAPRSLPHLCRGGLSSHSVKVCWASCPGWPRLLAPRLPHGVQVFSVASPSR